MNNECLLAELRAVVQKIPTPDIYSGNDVELAVIGKAEALLKQHDQVAAFSFSLKRSSLNQFFARDSAIREMKSILYGAISALELSVPRNVQQIYGPGATYDFYRDLKNIIVSATREVFLVDPYMNEEVFDLYVDKVPSSVSVRLLTNLAKARQSLSAVISKYKQRPGHKLEVHSTAGIHDRVLFIDGNECWLMGQSIKDAGTKPTYLAPLPADVLPDKLAFYENLWGKSQIC